MKKMSLIFFLFILFSLGVQPTLDTDFWWHLKTGEWALRHGIPHFDPFSFSHHGAPWIAHEWLSGVLLWAVYAAGGFPLIMVFFGLICVLTFYFLYLRSAGKPYLAIGVSLLAFSICQFLWLPKPQIFNIFFLSFFLFLINGVRWKKIPRKVLYWLCPATLIWANLHSGFVMGIVTMLVYFAGDSLHHYWFNVEKGVFDRKDLKQFFIVIAGSILCGAINPQGLFIYRYPFGTLFSQGMRINIWEWWSPDFRITAFWPFLIFLNLSILSFMAGRAKIHLTDGFLFLATATAGLLSMRHIPFFGLIAAPIVSRNLEDYFNEPYPESIFYKFANKFSSKTKTILAGIVLILGIVILGKGTWLAIRSNKEALEWKYPAKAVDFLDKTKMTEMRGFNEYSWGGYLIWRNIPVFIDGRVDMYGDEFFAKYLSVYYVQEGWKEILDEYKIDYILFPAHHPLLQLIDNSKDWVQVYNDGIAAIGVRSKLVTLIDYK